MNAQRIILTIVIALALLLMVLTMLENNSLPFIVRAIGFPLLALAYYKGIRSKKNYFFYFIVTFALCEFFGVFIYSAYTSPLVNDLMFYGRNTLYILSYVFLLLGILTSFEIKKTVKQFLISTIILVSIGSYMTYLATDITLTSESFGIKNIFDSLIVIAYNIIISLLLIAAVLNYLSKDSKKNMTILVGVICIVFSETIQLASFYVSSKLILSLMHTSLIILAFYFLFIESRIHSSELLKR